MKFEAGDYEYELTTEHAASSYGVPVIVCGTRAYGAYDTLPHGQMAYLAVKTLLPTTAETERFLASCPDLYLAD